MTKTKKLLATLIASTILTATASATKVNESRFPSQKTASTLLGGGDSGC